MNFYGVLADIVVFVHLLYVGYVVVGLLFILIGWPLKWSWIRNPWFRGTHLAMILIVAAEAMVSFECPLTTWEHQLRAAAGQTVHGIDVEGISFIGQMLRNVQFVGDHWEEYAPIVFYVIAGVIVATVFLVPPRCPGWLARLWDHVVAEPMRESDRECRAYQAAPEAMSVDRKTIIVLITTAVVLTMQSYFHGFEAVLWIAGALDKLGAHETAQQITTSMHDPCDGYLYRMLAWCGMRAVEWLLVPAIIIRFVFRERVTDYGLKLRGLIDGWWLYLVMLAVVLPLVFYVSSSPSFLRTYPYYQPEPNEPLWPKLWIWEAAYFAQFFCLEFFFRGFMVHGTKHRFGPYSIFVMTIPYCMIHFGKPLPETLGSIVAGVVLGFMSLKTRSIWLGTAVHITVALTMDLLALKHLGRLG